MYRSTEEVFREHLSLRLRHEVEQDISRNYAADVVLIASFGVFHGHNGIRRCARLLRDGVGEAQFTYKTHLVEGELAFLEWSARSAEAMVDDGVDTFLIRCGFIVAKTVHYSVQPQRA
jgi:hypothetical protein